MIKTTIGLSRAAIRGTEGRVEYMEERDGVCYLVENLLSL